MRALAPRRAALIAAIVSVALGAALVAACAGLFQTAIRLDAPPHRLAGADVVVSAGEHALLAPDGGKAAQAVTLTERTRLPASLPRETATVAGVARAVRDPRTGAIAITARPGVAVGALSSRLEDRLAGRHFSVLTGDDRGRAEATGVAASRLKLVLLSGIFGGMALIVMVILLASIIGLSVEQRQREIGLLRTIGATPRQVRRMVVRQTMAPVTAAAVAGALVGPVLGRALYDRVRAGGVVPDVLALHQGVVAIVAGALAAWLAARVSVGLGARRAGRVGLGEAIGEAEAQPGSLGPVRRVAGAVAAVGAVSCGVMTMFMSPDNAAATGSGVALGGAAACAFVAPWLTERLAARLTGAAQRLAGVPGELAVANVRARSHRTATLVTPVLLIAAIALANVYQQTTQGSAMRSAYRDGLRADAVVTATHGAITPRVTDAARKVGAASPLVTSKGWIEHPVDKAHRIDPWPLLGAEGPALRTKATDGSLADLRGDAVALPEALAHDLDIAVGDRIGMVLGDGAHVRLRVVALLGGSSRYASIVLPPDLLAAHTTAGTPRQLLVVGDGPVRRGLARALAGHPEVTVRGGSALADDYDTGLRVDAWITYAVVAVIIGYAAISLTNLLVASVSGRRRELALLRLAGATRRQVRRMLQAEALLVGAIGAITGTAVAIAALVPLSVATAGSPLPSGPAWVFLAVLAVIAALVLVPTTVVFRTTLQRQKEQHVDLV